MESNPYSSPSANLFGSSSITNEGVSQGTILQLQKTKPWVRFMSVMFYIGGILMVLFGVLFAVAGGSAFANMPNTANQGMPPGFATGMAAGMGLFYAAMGLIYIYPAVKLGKYATKISSLLNSGAVADLEAALNEQRGFWKFVGVLTVISLVLMVVGFGLAIVGAIVAGAAAAKHG